VLSPPPSSAISSARVAMTTMYYAHSVDPRQALLHRGGGTADDAITARHPVDEGIVATRVEQQNADPLGLRHFAEEEIERQRLIDQTCSRSSFASAGSK